MNLKIDISNFEKNSMKEFEENGKNVLIAYVDGQFYAIGSKCTHLGCKLVKGKLESNILTCPCHGSQFNITDGKVVNWIPNWGKALSVMTKKIGFAKNLKSYKTVIEKDSLLVEIE